MVKIIVDPKKCKGSGQCINVCPVGIYVMEKGKARPDPKKISTCLMCHACEVSCPNKAIKIE